MNYFSFLFYCLVQISAVFADPETADLAKGHCENWFISQGEEIENIFFKYIASGGQSDIYKCESLSENFDPSIVAIKMYQRPWEFNMTEREIIDTAMGNVNVGPIVYKFIETGKIEQFLDNMRSFESVNPEDDPDDWGHSGCIECAEDEVFNQTAILIARFHLSNLIETDLNLVPEKYEKEIWPWNTRLVYEHLSQPWFTDGGQDRAVARRLGISPRQMEDEWRWIESLYVDDSDLEITFCHNDIHPGNMMVGEGPYEAESHMLIDFDNSAWGYRGFDFNMHFTNLQNFPNDDKLIMFLESYRNEYRRICYTEGLNCKEPSLAQLEHEVRKTRAFGAMQRMMYMKTLTWLVFDKDVENYIESLKYFNREIGTPFP